MDKFKYSLLLRRMAEWKYWPQFVFSAVGLHLVLTVIYVSPDRFTQKAKPYISNYFYPQFHQSWRLFAKTPTYVTDVYLLRAQDSVAIMDDWRREKNELPLGFNWRKNVAQHSSVVYSSRVLGGLQIGQGKVDSVKCVNYFKTPIGKTLRNIVIQEANTLLSEDTLSIKFTSVIDSSDIYYYRFSLTEDFE